MQPLIPRKESIIITSIEIIDEMGINELSLRKIAERQGISDMALYRHFKNKEDLVMEILEYYCRYDSSIINTIEKNNMSVKEGIVFFIKSLIETYENQPAMTSIVNAFETLKDDNQTVNKVKDIFNNRSSFIVSLVKKGQHEGSIGSNFDSENLADIIMGIEKVFTLKWRISNYNFSLKERVVNSLETLLKIA